MKKIYLYCLFACTLNPFSTTAQVDLNFKTTAPIYSDGALSNNYTGIGNPAVDISVNVASNGSPTFNLGTPQPVTNGLQIVADFPNQTDSKVITIVFSQGVSNLSFSIYGVDKGANSQDKVTITADRYGNPVSPSITPSAYATVAGNTLLGSADEISGSNPSPVQFNDFVKTLTISFSSGSNAPANPGPQGITLGNFNWTSPLPVTLVSFAAKAINNAVQLSWSTTLERDADRFEVQRSRDLGEFITVGQVAAKGTTDQRQYYGFTDEYPLDGANYYRLRQVDTDGTVADSKPISVVLDDLTPALELLGNPIDGSAIHIATRNLTNATYHLSTITGRDLPLKVDNQADGSLLFIPVQPLSSGIYLLRAVVGENRLLQKVLVR